MARFTFAKPIVSLEEIVEYLKAHPGGTPRDMSRKRNDAKNRIVYFRMFGEVHRRNKNSIRTEFRVIGDGKGNPVQQLHYFWIG